MEPLDFPEIASLINHSRRTFIDYEHPVVTGTAWALYDGEHRVHAARYPFRVLYLQSRTTRDSLDEARNAVKSTKDLHVVYPPTLTERLKNLAASFQNDSQQWTTKEYLASFISDELSAYTNRLKQQRPVDYIDPRVEIPAGIPRKTPNPLRTVLLGDPTQQSERDGVLAILLAEPGQGKTYMSRYLVAEVAGSAQKLVPLMIDSTQWSAMAVEDQRSLWKTIANSFRHYDASIGWLEGHEDQFLRTTLKADLFRIVFDGFDEYVLRNYGHVKPLEVLTELAGLARDTGSRILITSRTSFWSTNLPAEESDQFVREQNASVFKILPFDQEHARNYFEKKFPKEPGKVNAALETYRNVKNQSEDLAGRGFVLNIIADVVSSVERREYVPGRRTNAVVWLMESLCDREKLRQQLPYNGDQQIQVLRSFAAESAMGEIPDTALLDLVLEEVRPDIDAETRSAVIEKFKSHPLLELDVTTDNWRFREEQIRIACLAEQIVHSGPQEFERFLQRLIPNPTALYDLGEMIVDVIRMEFHSEHIEARLRELIYPMSRSGYIRKTGAPKSEGPALAAVIVAYAVDKLLPHGSAHTERRDLMLRLAGVPIMRGLRFSGTIARYDLHGVTFEYCTFDHVTWVNCQFDETTEFRRCHVTGGDANPQTKGVADIRWLDCTKDEEAEMWLNRVQVNEGKKAYGEEELRADMNHLLKKFVIRGGLGLKGVKEKDIFRGPIGQSRHRQDILDALASTTLRLDGPASNRGYDVRPEAVEDLRFYAVNNVMTGRLRDAFDRLKRRILD